MDCGPTCLRMVAKHYGRSYTAQSLREKAQIGKDGVSLLGIAEAAEAIGFRSMGVKVSFEKLANEAPLPCIVHWDQNHFVVLHAIKGVGSGWLNRIRGGRKSPGIVDVDSDVYIKPFNRVFQIDEEDVIIPPTRQSVLPDSFPAQKAAKPRGTVYVADPARGLLSYSAEEFCQHWLSASTAGQEEGVVLFWSQRPRFLSRTTSRQRPTGSGGCWAISGRINRC